MCAIISLLLADHSRKAVYELVEGLGLLQHRGQDAAGIITCGPKGRLYQRKGNGMVTDVFDSDAAREMAGRMGIGHTRYPTAGSSSISEAQPFYVNSPYGIVLAHNGNLVNATELRKFLDADAHRHINTDSDSELLLNILANNLQKTGKFRINEEDIFTAIGDLMKQCEGGYACVGMLAGFGLIAFRDPNGIRPLVYGRRASTTMPDAYDYMFASESVSLSSLGFTDIVDVEAGEAVIVTSKQFTKRLLIDTTQYTFTPCIFEYVYFARPDSILNGISVYRSRMAMGEALADQVVQQLGKDHDIDVVMPVPDTSRTAALELASKLNLPYREGFVKNRYVGRTFIMPEQEMRRKSVRRKLNAMDLEFEGKNVLLVDDSIVRGTTSKEIITMAREAGAKKVYFASASPIVRFPNVYGIDMPSSLDLVGHDRDDKSIALLLGADRVIYQTIEDLIDCCRRFNPKIAHFDTSVFDGQYVTPSVNEQYLAGLQTSRPVASSRHGSPQPCPSSLSGRQSNALGVTAPQPPVVTASASAVSDAGDSNVRGHRSGGAHDDDEYPYDEPIPLAKETIGLHNSYGSPRF
ncbi:amidophosphoribosyltransferase [Ramicandelaber brevisporus]|nr:amidophosphoribosyltransferase [Ramicandelaber brevisporus]